MRECAEGGGVMLVFSGGFAHALCRKWSEVTVWWQVCTFEGHLGRILSVAFSPDGKNVVTGSEDCVLKIWDIERKSEVRSFVGVRCRCSTGVIRGFRSFPAGFTLDVV